MCGKIVIVLLAFITLAHTKEAQEDFGDKFVHKLLDKLVDRNLKAWSFHHTGLENTTLEKVSGHLARPRTPSAVHTRLYSGRQPSLPHGTVRTGPFFSKLEASGIGARTLCNAAQPSAGTVAVDPLPGVDCASCDAQFPPFKGVDSSGKFSATIMGLAEAGKVPAALAKESVEFQQSYKAALMKSPRAPDADKEASEVMAAITERVLVQFKDPYTFPSKHMKIQQPFDYYAMLQRFSGNLINFDASYVGHAERILDMKQAIARGENVLLLANHQSEADPGVWAWMTNELAPSLASDIFYVAGDRVVLDSLAKPFSMGRNLICVHSKRHQEDDPALKAAKMATNQKSVRELRALFKEGGAIVWVAPSGGRDRKDASGEYAPAAFDAAAVVLLRRMMDASDKPGHAYPMAMASAEICPPPARVEKALGEQREVNFHGVGISIGEELNTKEMVDGIEGKNEQNEAYTAKVFDKVKDLYAPLADVVYGKTAPGPEFTQPWKK